MTRADFPKMGKYFLLSISFLLVLVNHAFAVERYSLIELKTTGYNKSTAMAINNNGVVAGIVNNSEGLAYPARWVNGNVDILYQFGPATAVSINDSNEIAGLLWESGNISGPFIWYVDGIRILFMDEAVANDINNNSQMIITDFHGYETPYFWENGAPLKAISIDQDPVWGLGSAINDLGQAVGFYFPDDDDPTAAFLWHDDEFANLNDLINDGFEGHLRDALDINATGQIIGPYTPDGGMPWETKFFLFDDGQVTDLGRKVATAINDSGQIVGNHYIYQDGQWSDLYELIESDITFSDLIAKNINNKGQIVGSVKINGMAQAVLLNPTATLKSLGNEQVFSSKSINKQRTAMPYDMPEDGAIESVSIYHEGGGGKMLLAVYDGDGSPERLLAVTAPTKVQGQAGWQTIDLENPVSVSQGAKVWLAWVFERNPGVRYETGSPGRARANPTWSGGMPDNFGSSYQRNFIYSIYATYSTRIDR